MKRAYKDFSELVTLVSKYLQQIETAEFIDVSQEDFFFYNKAESKEKKNDFQPIKKNLSKSPPLKNPLLEESSKEQKIKKDSLLSENKEQPKPNISIDQSSISFFAETKILIQKIFPDFALINLIPSDEKAKIQAELWKKDHTLADVVIFQIKKSKESLLFLTNLKQAIENKLCSCQIIDASKIEAAKKWDIFFSLPSPQLILSPPSIFHLPELLAFYKENPAIPSRHLNKSPLILFKPLAEYHNDPLQKKALWEEICKILKK